MRNISILLVFLLLASLLLPALAGAVADSEGSSKGICTLDVCKKDPSVIFHGELTVFEGLYHIPMFRTIAKLPAKTKQPAVELVISLPDRPPAVLLPLPQ
ncbi:MAG: hypothetical protein Q8K68_03325 [Nitrospirota bacterium]|nr:hypothetical protein [Nitrospirota bacterium]